MTKDTSHLHPFRRYAYCLDTQEGAAVVWTVRDGEHRWYRVQELSALAREEPLYSANLGKFGELKPGRRILPDEECRPDGEATAVSAALKHLENKETFDLFHGIDVALRPPDWTPNDRPARRRQQPIGITITSPPVSREAAPEHESPITPAPPGCLVSVSNLEYTISRRSLIDLFSNAGTVKRVRMLYRQNGQPLGAAIVTMETPEQAIAALAQNGARLGGRPVKLKLLAPDEPSERQASPELAHRDAHPRGVGRRRTHEGDREGPVVEDSEASLDATRGSHIFREEDGRYGSHASHDAYDEESDP